MTPPAQSPGYCSVCHAALPGNALGGLCPKCLLRAGFEVEEGRNLHIRCPHCQAAIEVVDEASLREVTCPSCDSRFSLVGDRTTAHTTDEPPRVGRFQLLERVGTGAFGSVWKANDPQLNRVVAIKIPRKEQLSRDEAEQFLREARFVARLRHPGIVAVHEVGRDGDRIFIVSDFIEGVTLADVLTAHRPTAREAAELGAKIADALQHAHECGVIHRDLKPSNIILDDSGRPHVTDFGLAKQEAAEVTITADGRVLGTPAYMSPEQARGEAHAADARSDIYSLGVILYELLTGEKPFRGTSRMLLHQVLHDDAPSPRNLNQLVPRDLETICLKCLEKDPGRRYQSARELREDLLRFTLGEPVRAQPITRVERAWRWCRRKPTVAALGLLLAVSLTVGLLTTTWQWRVARRSFREAEAARATIQQQAVETKEALVVSESRLARLFIERGLQKVDVDPHAGFPWFVQALQAESGVGEAARLNRLRIDLMLEGLPKLCGYWPAAAEAEFSFDGTKVAIAVGQEATVYDLPSMRAIGRVTHGQPIVGIQFTRQGDRLATIAHNEQLPPECRIWDASTGEALSGTLSLKDEAYGMRDTPSIHFSEEGDKFIVICAGLYNRWHTKMTARVFDSRSLRQLAPTFAHHCDLDYAEYFELSPDGLRVLVPRGIPADDANVDWDNPKDLPETSGLRQYDLMTGQELHVPMDQPLHFYPQRRFGYSADGSWIVAAAGGVVRVWDSKEGKLVREFSLSPGVSDAVVQFHPDGRSLFAIENRQAMWWDLETGNLKKAWRHDNQFNLSPTGRYAVYSDSSNGATYLRDISDEDADSIRMPETSGVRFCADGSRFELRPAGHYEAAVYIMPPERVFRSADGRPVTPPWRFDGQLSHDGRFLLSNDETGVWLWDLDRRNASVQRFLPANTTKVSDVKGSHDARIIGVLCEGGRLAFYDANSGEPIQPPVQLPRRFESESDVQWEWLQFDRSARRVAIVGRFAKPTSEDEQRKVPVVLVWDVASSTAVLDPIVFDAEPESWLDSLQFVRQDRELVLFEYCHGVDQNSQPSWTSGKTRLHVCDLVTGVTTSPRVFERPHSFLQSSPDGERCLVVQRDGIGIDGGSAFVLDTRTWEPVTSRMIPEGGAPAWNATFSPDGRKIVMGGGEIWDAEAGERLIEATVPHRDVRNFVFRQDGESFIAVIAGRNFPWDKPTELRWISLSDGAPLSAPLVEPWLAAPACAAHPHLAVVATASDVLRLWDLGSGMMLSTAIELPFRGRGDYGRNRDGWAHFSPDGRRLYIESGGEMFVLRWGEIVDAIPPDDVLIAWSAIVSGSRVDDAGGLVPLVAADYVAAWNTVRPTVDDRFVDSSD